MTKRRFGPHLVLEATVYMICQKARYANFFSGLILVMSVLTLGPLLQAVQDS